MVVLISSLQPMAARGIDIERISLVVNYMTSHLMLSLTFTVSAVPVVLVVLVVHYSLNHVNAVYFRNIEHLMKNQSMKLNCQIMKCYKPVVVKIPRQDYQAIGTSRSRNVSVAYWKIYSRQIRIKKILLQRC